MDLRKKSVHELRTMAQAFGVTDIFEKDAIHLVQEIELKQQKLIPAPTILPPKPEYDARLMDAKPAQRGDMDEITELLKPYIERGLHLRFEEECWFMDAGKKTDTGTIRMPLKSVLECARRVML
jgi:hypothetical protein